MQEMTLFQTLLIALIQIILAIMFVFVVVPLTIFAERKVIGFLQQRLGSTRVAGRLIGVTAVQNRLMWFMGWFPFAHYFRGLPGIVGDIAKLFFKEDVKLSKSDRAVYLISPAIAMIAAIMTYSVICFYPGTLFTIPTFIPLIGGLPVAGAIANINVGLLLLLGFAGVGVYGIVLGAWASNSKYPLLGGLRSAAQMVSYEVPLTLSLCIPIVLAGSLNLAEMARGTAIDVSPWGIPSLFAGFFIYMTCGFAETNRLPFDMPEAEAELIAGFHTEYSGMKFGLFYLAEYINMSVVSALASAFFLGGPWLLPFGLQGVAQNLLPAAFAQGWFGTWLLAPHWYFFVAKVFTLLFVFIWVRGSWPRYRYDQVMDVAWKYLIPLTIVNLVVAGFVRYHA